MDEFKISLFENEYKKSFPMYTTLTKDQAHKLMGDITTKYNVDGTNFEVDLASKQTYYTEFDALEDFSLKRTLAALGVKPVGPLYVNWYKFDSVDLFNLDDFDKFFYDIWFEAADDVDLFDETLTWILSIRHDGCVSLLRHTDAI